MKLPNLVNKGDWIDLVYEIRRKGISSVLQRFSLNSSTRVIHSWECIDHTASDWWIIPAIRRRWNHIISGNPGMDYTDYVVEKYFKGRRNLKLLSAGSGGGTAEIKFASHDCFSEVKGFDISEKIVSHANSKFAQHGLTNLHFFAADVYTLDFGRELYDAILFNSSLHHFKKPDMILEKAMHALKPTGLLIIFEYVGPDRFQWKTRQLIEVNKMLKNDLPVKFKEKRIKGSYKKKVFKPGLLRMIFADPSESVCSSRIPGAIKKYFYPLEEKQLGGNLLHPLLKDIAHHFVNSNTESDNLLNELVAKEDNFMLDWGSSDILFGVYRK